MICEEHFVQDDLIAFAFFVSNSDDSGIIFELANTHDDLVQRRGKY